MTTVVAGSTLKVKWTETVGHPGHFRIAIAANDNQFVTPAAVVQNNDCKSAAIQSSPVAPVLKDGLFVHGGGTTGAAYEQDVVVPNIVCNPCRLQLLQFMSSHTPPCFYFHCANLKIVAPAADAGADAGASLDAGSVVDSGSFDAGSVDSGSVDSGSAVDSGTADSGVVDAGMSSIEPDAGQESGGPPVGCGCGASPGVLALAALSAWSGLKRARRGSVVSRRS